GVIPVPGEVAGFVVEIESPVTQIHATRVFFANKLQIQNTPLHFQRSGDRKQPQVPRDLIPKLVYDLARLQMPNRSPQIAGRRHGQTFRASPVATDSRIRKVVNVVLANDVNGMGASRFPVAASRKAANSTSNPLSIPEVL